MQLGKVEHLIEVVQLSGEEDSRYLAWAPTSCSSLTLPTGSSRPVATLMLPQRGLEPLSSNQGLKKAVRKYSSPRQSQKSYSKKYLKKRYSLRSMLLVIALVHFYKVVLKQRQVIWIGKVY